MSFVRLLSVLVALLLTAVGQGAVSPLPPMPPRPGGDAGPTKVTFAVWIGDVTRIDSVAQTFTTNMVIVFRWRDPQLAHAGPGAKRFALDDIWHPRVLITNEAEPADLSLPETADVAPDGMVVYRQRYVGTYTQNLNLRAFPFDRDTFHIHLVALGHRPEDIQFEPDPVALQSGLANGIGIDASLTIQDWLVSGITTKIRPFQVTPDIALAGFGIELSAARRSHHFILKVILPLILIVAMSWAVFWIEPTDAATQVGLSVTAMLTLIAYRFAIDGDVPKLPYLTRLDAFVLMATILVFLSLIEVLVTTKFANRDRLLLARAIDRRCRWVFPLVFATATVTIFLIPYRQ